MTSNIINKMIIRDDLLIMIEGFDARIRNGKRVIDENGNSFIIKSVGLPAMKNPKDLFKNTELLLSGGTEIGNQITDIR